jgi:hypothetical protein
VGKLASSIKVKVALAEALGLNPKDLTSIKMELNVPDAGATFEITGYLNDETDTKLAEVVRSYVLVEKEEDGA